MADYNYLWDTFEASDLRVLGATVDSIEDVQAMNERLGLKFPVIAEVDRAQVIDGLGAYPLDRRGTYHPVNMILDENGAVDVVSYSSDAIGRIGVEEALRFLI